MWQNQPTAPTQTVNYLYDGSGNRVAMQSTVNGTTTLTTYIGSIEEVQTSGSTTQTTTYYAVGGKRVAADVNGAFYYFGYDALGSQVAVLNSTGSLVGAQLYGPYGASRYNTGTLPTSIGFTGQRADSVTGLDYYNARYYDPGVGQFLSVDEVQGNGQGMDPYAYVGENPETNVDPTGQRASAPDGSTSWTNPDGSIYVESPGGDPTVIGHTHSSGSGSGGTTRPTSSGKRVKGTRPSVIKPASCTFLDCVQNRAAFAGGVAMILSGVSILAIGISAFFASDGTMSFVQMLAQSALRNAAAAIAGWIQEGIILIHSSLYSYADPKILNIVMDGIAILSDLATIVFSGLDMIEQLGPKRAGGILSAVGYLMNGLKNAQSRAALATTEDDATAILERSVFPGRVKAVGADLANSAGSLGLLVYNTVQLVQDIKS